MKKLESLLAYYAYQKQVVPSLTLESYEYIAQVALEMLSGILASVALGLYLDMMAETVLFLLIYSIIRSYAGGLHLERFASCFCMSFLVTAGTLIFVKAAEVSGWMILAMLLAGQAAFRLTEPGDNKNRRVDEEENQYFKRKLRQYLTVFAAVCMAFLAMGVKRYALLVAVTIDVAYVFMVLGKRKDEKTKENSGVCH